MLLLNAAEVRAALPMRDAIEAMKRAYAALSAGRAIMPPRPTLAIPTHGAMGLVMPAYVELDAGNAFSFKIVAMFPGNRARGLALIQSSVFVMEEDTGRPLALLDGGTLTAIRTGAASGAATDLLAREDCRTAVILGAGVQARTQLEGICTARSLQTVWICHPDRGKAAAFAADVSGRGPIPGDVRGTSDVREALSGADVVCTATTSKTPVFEDDHVRPATHINAVGSFEPHVQEIPAATLLRARVVVDDRDAALEETGDLIRPIEEGLYAREKIHADMGELVLGQATGRETSDEITLFKSVGLAVQDALAAQVALENARDRGLGKDIDWP